MSFKNLEKRQNKLKEKLFSNPILEFRKTEKTVKIQRNTAQPVVYIIYDSEKEPIYVGRVNRSLSNAFSKFAVLGESDTLELFPFSREDAATAFYRRILYHYNPKFNCERREVNCE